MQITTTKNFDKQFKKQPKKIQIEFANRVDLLLFNINSPTLNIHKLSGKMKDLWSFNVSGDIRVVFDRSYKDVFILVSIGTHSELYT